MNSLFSILCLILGFSGFFPAGACGTNVNADCPESVTHLTRMLFLEANTPFGKYFFSKTPPEAAA
jgi:hypothetical protein